MSVTELGPREPEFERTPPNDITAEQGVLGGMLLSQDAIAEVIEVLRTHDFYRPAHQIIYDTVLDLYGRGDPADAVTVAGELTKRGEIGRIGGAPYLHTLISSVPTAANAGYYAKIVRERSVLRKLVETGTRIVQMGYAADGADADEVLDRAQAEVFAIADKRTSEDYVPLSEIMPGALDEIEAIGSRGGQMVGVPTGFADLDALTNGLHPGQMVVIAARPAMGKATSLDTPLPTPSGWTTMGEVSVGDYLIGADGKPTRVVAATEVMHGRPCYEIEFSDGEVIVADAEHQWRTTTRASRRQASETRTTYYWSDEAINRVRWATAFANERPGRLVSQRQAMAAVGEEFRHALYAVTRQLGHRGEADTSISKRQVRYECTSLYRGLLQRAVRPTNSATTVQHRPIKTTEEIAATLRCDGDDRPNHAVEVAAPFQLPEANLPIDPYVLGAWLGDGSSRHGSITCFDEEILDEIEAAGQPVVRRKTPGLFGLPGLTRKIRDMGLWRNKHIPRAYLRASERQRRALLAGMLDTDGYVSVIGQVQLAFVYKRLAEDAHELILSLGYRATMTTKPVAGRSPETSTFYRINFTPTETVFRLPRKAARQRKNVHPKSRVRYIVDVRPVESVPVRCVQVDNADHMYLVGRSCIPTHNSTLALDFARAASIKHGLTAAFFSLEMGRNEITMRLLSAESRVALHAMRSGTMQDEDWTRLARRMSEVAEAPLFIDDSPNMSMMEIRAKCRRLKQQHDLRLVIVDYLQLMMSGKRVESRQVEVSEFSRSLKLLAKELGVPVIALSQLNRGPEQRTDKKPMVSDLRESGCLSAETRLLRADTGSEITMRDLMASGARDIPVWSLDERLKLVPRTLTHAFPSGTRETFRVRLASGRTVQATANHPFLTYDGWMPLGELNTGSRVAVPRHLPAPLRSESWPEDEIVMLAHLIGDGSFVEGQPIRYASKDEANLTVVAEAALRRFGITAIRDDQAATRCTSLRLPAPYRLTHGTKNPIAEWLDGLGLFGLRGHEKFIPDGIFGLPDDQLALFVHHLWATDGAVTIGGSGAVRVSYGTTSERLARQLQLVLLRFDIKTRLRAVDNSYGRPQWTLDVCEAEDQRRFLEEIGVHGERSALVAQALRRLDEVRALGRIDTIPGEVWEQVREAMTARSAARAVSQGSVGTVSTGDLDPDTGPSRNRLSKVASILDREALEMLATNDVFWDEIVSIESLGELPVYDATVMGTHNFVANGIHLKNSIEQDADMVILLHREDAYEKESPRAGEADLIVAKHRNGPTATVTVAFQGHYSRFVDMAQ
jgi:replicative DNA helicase